MKEFPLNWSRTSSRQFTKEFPLILIWVHFTKDSLGKNNSKEILCKFFLKFQTWIGFFSTFFEQNPKTRKFRTFIYLIPQVCQVSVKLKNFFFDHPPPPPPSTIHHPSVTIISTIGKSIFSLLLDLKSKNSIEGHYRQVNIFSASRLKVEKLNRRSNREAVWLTFWYFLLISLFLSLDFPLNSI